MNVSASPLQVMYSHDHLTDVCPSLVVTSLGLSPDAGHLLFLLMIALALHLLDRQVWITGEGL